MASQKEQQAWDDELRKDNEQYLAESEKSRYVQLEIIAALSALIQTAMKHYPIEDGVAYPPYQISQMIDTLISLRRTFQEEKIEVFLLGQDDPVYYVDLPEWAKLKEV